MCSQALLNSVIDLKLLLKAIVVFPTEWVVYDLHRSSPFLCCGSLLLCLSQLLNTSQTYSQLFSNIRFKNNSFSPKVAYLVSMYSYRMGIWDAGRLQVDVSPKLGR